MAGTTETLRTLLSDLEAALRHSGKPALLRMLPIAIATLAGLEFATAHGGGCRKDSPPGQCCHMDRKAGTSHCH